MICKIYNIFVQRSWREPWTSISKCVNVCHLFPCLWLVESRNAISWMSSTRSTYICCIMKLRKGRTKLCRTQTFCLANLWKSKISNVLVWLSYATLRFREGVINIPMTTERKSKQLQQWIITVLEYEISDNYLICFIFCTVYHLANKTTNIYI